MIKLTESQHASSSRRRYAGHPKHSDLRIPKTLNLDTSTIVEVTVYGERKFRKVRCVLARVRYDQFSDLCLVVDVINGRVITAYLNAVSDNHPSLDTTRYGSPEPARYGKKDDK